MNKHAWSRLLFSVSILICALATISADILNVKSSNWKTYDESSIPNAPIGESDPADNGRYLIVPYENLFIDDTQTASLTTLRWPELPESITDQTRIRITLSVRVFSSTPDLSGVVLDCNFLGKYTQTHRLQSNTNWTGPYECADDISLERWEEAKKDANNKRLARIELVASKSMSQTTEGSHFALRVAIADLQLKVKLDDVDEINIPFQYDTFDQHWTYRFETGSKNQELTKTDSLWSNPALISVPFKLASLHNFEKWIHPSPIQPNAEIEEKPQEPVTKYWYTDRSDTTIQLVSLQQEMLAKNQDLCFIFYYAASERTQLKVTMSRPDADFEMPADQTAKGKKEADKWIDAPLIHDKRTLVTLQPTLSNQRELDWHQVQICVKRDVLPAFADQSLPNGKYTLNLTSLIHEEDAKKRVVALSLVDANSIEMQKVIAHSLLSDWDDQGSQATVEWHRESISSHFQWVVRSTDEAVGKSKAQIELNRAANKHATGYNLVSDWIWLKDDRSADTSTEEIDESWMFEEDGLESNDRNTTTIEEETTTIESDGNVAKPLKQTLKFSFDDVEEKGASDDLELELNVRYCVHKGNLVILAQNEQLQIGKLLTKRLNCDDVNHPVVLRDNKVKISDAAKAKLKGQRVRFIVSIQIEEDEHAVSNQTVTIESVQLKNVCNRLSTNPCSGSADDDAESAPGRCVPINRHRYRCECPPQRHGRFCQYRNRCVTKVSNEPNATTGDEICGTTEHAIGCREFGQTFYCKCSEGHKWNASNRKCEPAPPCLFSNCGMYELCVEDVNSTIGYTCECEVGYERNSITQTCQLNACENACSSNEKCALLPGDDAPTCYCKPGFKPASTDEKTGCIPIDRHSPLIRQWNQCEHVMNEEGQCACYAGYTYDEQTKRCEMNEEMREPCASCQEPKICQMSTTNDTTHYHCSCPAGLDGDDCDQETYCSDSSNAKSIGQLCGFSEATCEMNNGRYSCANCAPNYEVDVRSGRCVLRLDLCQNANCARDREVCRYQNDGTNVNVMCDCAPGYVRSESDSGESCVPACSLKTCDKTEGECVWDALNGKAQCTCRPGYAFENEKCVLNENAVYVSGRLRLKVQPEQMDNQRRLVKLMRSHPDLNCTKTIDVGSCIRAAANLNSQLLGPDPPHQSGYLLLEFERTLEEMLQKFDEEWAVAAGQPVPSIKSQARVISLRPVHPMKSIDVATTLGLFAEYEAKLALVVVGAELGERERQWRQACIRQPLPAHLIVSTDNFELDGEEKEQESVQLTQAKNEQQCVIMNRLSWLPRLTRVGWLDMCRLNMHSCDRHTTCRGRRGQYRCECNAGFRRDKEVIRNSFVQDMCLDIDECAESLHQCQKWTVCENTLGSYRCNCFENFRRLTDYQCVETCDKTFPCVNGRCEVFAKHYEICRCHDGFKGEDCSIEDPKVTKLRHTLITVAVGFGLLVLTTFSFAFLFIQSSRVKAKNLRRALQNGSNEIQMTSNGRNSPNAHENPVFQNDSDLTRV